MNIGDLIICKDGNDYDYNITDETCVCRLVAFDEEDDGDEDIQVEIVKFLVEDHEYADDIGDRYWVCSDAFRPYCEHTKIR